MPVRRLIKVGIALALFAVAIFLLLPAVLFSSSQNAIVTARLAAVASPVTGRLEYLAVSVGDAVEGGMEVARIVNPRVDQGRELGVATRIADAEARIRSIIDQVAFIDDRMAELEQRSVTYTRARIRTLEAQYAEARSEITEREAAFRVAREELERIRKLAEREFTSRAALEKAEGDYVSTRARLESARQRAAAIAVELDAAKEGTFVGDSYNDQPYSSQRLDELTRRKTELQAEKTHLEGRLPALQRELSSLRDQTKLGRHAELLTPGRGRVWTVNAERGETVMPGQHVLNVIECDSIVVAANVSESDYNILIVGTPAMFRPYGTTERVEGKIIKLAGAGSFRADERLAIPPRRTGRDDFIVYLRFPALVPPCDIGRTGAVVFEVDGLLNRRLGSLVRGILDRVTL